MRLGQRSVFLAILSFVSPLSFAKSYDASYFCSEANSAFEIAANMDHDATKPPLGAELLVVNELDLTDSSPEDEQGHRLRIGTKTSTRRCGELTIEFSAGWLNANPYGREGADDYLRVRVLQGSRILLDHTALGACIVGSSPGSASIRECPAGWATRIRGGRRNDSGRSAECWLSLDRNYSESIIAREPDQVAK